MERTGFEDEHEMFREAFRTFVEREMVPHREKWEQEGIVDRDIFAKAGASTNTLDQTQITIVKSDTATGQREIVVKSSFEGTDTATGLPIAVDSKAAQTRALSTVANSDSVSAADLVSDMNETITASGGASNVVASLVVVLVVVLNL